MVIGMLWHDIPIGKENASRNASVDLLPREKRRNGSEPFNNKQPPIWI